MPKVQRKDIPRALFAHLLARIAERSIDAEAATQLSSLFRHWSKQQLEQKACWRSGKIT